MLKNISLKLLNSIFQVAVPSIEETFYESYPKFGLSCGIITINLFP
jgi:hypothetical protein